MKRYRLGVGRRSDGYDYGVAGGIIVDIDEYQMV